MIVVCETVAAISLHFRELQEGEKPCYSGRKRADAQTLCGLPVGWNLKISVDCIVRTKDGCSHGCSTCLETRPK